MILLRTIFIFVLLVSNLTSASAADRRSLFPADRQEEGVNFQLQGVGTKNILFIKIFVAGLYLGEKASPEDALKNVPKKLEVAYSQAIPAQRLAKETRQRIWMNVGETEYQRLKSRIDKMDHYFVNIKPGDHYALTYIPGQGTRFTYNDQLVGVIEGEDFAKGLFAVWVGSKPIDPNLKAALLGS